MIITLLSDFGTADYFVGAMKGAALAVNPAAVLVDITHEIAPHDVAAGAFTLAGAYGAFPAGTTHLAVVDPGVGSSRRPIVVHAGGYCFVGPDNGLFSYVYERESPSRAFHLTNQELFRSPVSPTFHGRDIFAPVAAALSRGVSPEALGPEIFDRVALPSSGPYSFGDPLFAGEIIHIDRFGNCVTNFARKRFTTPLTEPLFSLEIGGQYVTKLLTSYSDEVLGDELFVVWGSAGYLEISMREKSAAEMMGLRLGDRVNLRMFAP